jgi:hypothetical protein
VEGHERHHIFAGRVWHRLVGGDDPLDSLGEGGSWSASTRRRSCSRETLERAQFEITTTKSRASWERKRQRRCGCKRTRSSRGKREGERKQTESKVPNQHLTRGFKGDRPDSPSSASAPPCQQDFRPLTRTSR